MRRVDFREVAWVGALCLLLLLVLLPYYSYGSMLILIQQEWGMTSTEAGFVFGATQVGYVSAVLLLLPLTDRVRTSYVLLGSTVLSLVGGALFPLLAHGMLAGAIFRALGGAGLAGTYMPGLRLISERYSGHRRGGPVGFYVASFTFGGAVSFAATAALVPVLGWRGTYLSMALPGAAAILLAALLLKGERAAPQRHRPAKHSVPLSAVLHNRPLLLIILGYSGHVWELFGMRSWLAPFLATILITMGGDATSATAQAALLASVTVILGTAGTTVAGGLSDRVGRATTAATILAGSAVCSLTFGWLMGAPFWVVIGASMVYGALVNPDSPIYSTGVTELAPPSRLGTAMAFQNTAGWTVGIVSPIAFGFFLDRVPGDAAWGLGFACLGVGALLGVAAMVALRRSPESKLLAGGRG